MSKRILSGLLAIVLLIAALGGCDHAGTSSEIDPAAGDKDLFDTADVLVTFGEEVKTANAEFELSGGKEPTPGSVLKKSYWKITDKQNSLRFSVSEDFAKSLSGRDLIFLIEYYSSGNRNYSLSYTGENGLTEQSITVKTGDSIWTGDSLRVTDFKYSEDSEYDFEIKLDTANQIWLSSVRVRAVEPLEEGMYPCIADTENMENYVIADATVADFGAVGDGVADDSIAFSAALDAVSENGGGTVFVPAGRYKLTQNITIPRGCVLQGDFIDPAKQGCKAALAGTRLEVYPASLAEGGEEPFFNVQRAAALKGMTVWYPEQKLVNGEPIEYAYTIEMSGWQNVIVQDVYLVNSYRGIQDTQNDHNSETVRNVYMAALETGLVMQYNNDTARFATLSMGPEWWLESGLPNTPSKEELLTWMQKYGTGVIVDSVDDGDFEDLTVNGYKIGISLGAKGYAQIFNLNIADCNTGFYLHDGGQVYGFSVTNGSIAADSGIDPVAIRCVGGNTTPLSFYNVALSSTGNYVVRNHGTSGLAFTDCTFKLTGQGGQYAVFNESGYAAIYNCSFESANSTAKCAYVSDAADGVAFAACNTGETLTYDSMENATVTVDSSETRGTLPDSSLENYGYQVRLPGQRKLWLGTEHGISTESVDNAAALQALIEEVAADGGGIIYLPLGSYPLQSPVTVKGGVEIRGQWDSPHFMYNNTATFITDYGKNDPNGTALITMEADSGLRGINVAYDKTGRDGTKYAYTIRGNGENIYVINCTTAGGYQGIDFNTYRCDNHYIEGFSFGVTGTGIHVGGGSKNGVVRDCQSNTGAELRDNPFSDTANWVHDGEQTVVVTEYAIENTTAFAVGDCENEIMLSNTIYAAHIGYWFHGNANVSGTTNCIDQAYYGFLIEDNANVRLTGSSSPIRKAVDSYGVYCSDGYTGKTQMLNFMIWAVGNSAAYCGGGELELYSCILSESGKVFLNANGGKIRIGGSLAARTSLATYLLQGRTESVYAAGNIYFGTKRIQNNAGAALTGIDFS